MLSHVTVGTADIERSKRFYVRLLEPLGLRLVLDMPDRGFLGWAAAPDRRPLFLVMRPFDGGEPAPGNGGMVAFEAESHATVDAFHAAGVAAGGTDEGAPGPRPRYHRDYYGAYLRDPDGNKLCCACHRPGA